jgi:hypothetical protein
MDTHVQRAVDIGIQQNLYENALDAGVWHQRDVVCDELVQILVFFFFYRRITKHTHTTM